MANLVAAPAGPEASSLHPPMDYYVYGVSSNAAWVTFEVQGPTANVDLVVGRTRFDNGQHILIGAYREALALMRAVGADPERCLRRCGLDLRHVDGTGLVMPAGAGVAQLLRAVLAARGWSPAPRLALAARAFRWRIAGFRCNPAWTVERLAAGLPQRIRKDLVDPLCIAALNTPARTASAEVFLRVIHDALFGGAGSADLLLPRVPLSELLAEPACAWLAGRGAVIHQQVH